MNCDEAKELLTPYFDDELDSMNGLAVEKHLRGCGECSAMLDRLRALREAIRTQAPYHRATPQLRARIEAARGERRRYRFLPQVTLAAAALLAAAVIWQIAVTPRTAVEDEVVSAHIRSMLANHLMDVPSTDQHTVKPWFAGKLDFAPDVADRSAEGFTLVGGRLDYIEGKDVAALIYKRRLHTINVFTWPSAGEIPVKIDSKKGFTVAHWKRAGMEWWAVSDLNANELKELAR